jgi:hypothetical protein
MYRDGKDEAREQLRRVKKPKGLKAESISSMALGRSKA